MEGFIQNFAKLFILLGLIIFLFGVFLFLVGKIPFFGKLPGDILIQKKNLLIYFPLTTSILLSILLTLFLYIFHKK